MPCRTSAGDNQMPDDVRRIIVALRKAGLWDAILVEASGNIPKPTRIYMRKPKST